MKKRPCSVGVSASSRTSLVYGTSLRIVMVLSLPHTVISGTPNFRSSSQRDSQDDTLLDSAAIEGRLAFVHIPKNGGSVIEDAGLAHGVRWGSNSYELQGRKLMPDGHICSSYHVPINVLETQGPDYANLPYEGKEVFCVVRNPVERAVSEYIYLLDMPWGKTFSTDQHTGLFRHPACSKEGLNTFVRTTLNLVRNGEPYIDDCHHLPQADFIWDSEGKQVCKHIFRMESLSSTFNEFMAAFGSGIRLSDSHLNHSSNAKCPGLSGADLDSSSLELLRSIYVDDFRLLGYDSPP